MNGAIIGVFLVIIAYLVMMLAIGFFYSKGNNDSSDFYLGGRKLGPFVTAMSAEASDMSSWLLMGLPGVAYLSGTCDAAWTAIGLAIGTYLNWLIVAKRLRRYSAKTNSITMPDFFSNRYRDDSKLLLGISAIFIIILLIFKSISLPIILVSVIEFAITINMAIPFYQGKSLPFVASIVIGAIQLGATVDYAILMTTRYQKERMKGKSKKESVAIAHRISMPSIITSGLSFFAATFGVTCYTQVDMIGSICELLSRGAIISVIVVLTVLPAMFLIFDPVICRTTAGYRVKKDKSKTVAEPTA